MNERDTLLYQELELKITEYEKENTLPGIPNARSRDCFVRQLIDSIKRIEYLERIQQRDDRSICIDPNSTAFSPLKAAVFHKRNGNIDEAFWLVFLAIHFGKSFRNGWGLQRSVYNGLGLRTWSWIEINNHLDDFLEWLNNSQNELKQNGRFGNHRKYVSLSATKLSGTGAAIRSYLEWVDEYGSHDALIEGVEIKYGTDPNILFDGLYRETSRLRSFARMGKFDLLTMIGKMNLINIEPGSLYMQGATGPMNGARELFRESLSPSEFDARLIELGEILDTPFAMQVLEDAICNWQKNTTTYSHFRG